jgi:hypothetical protein
MTDSMFTFDARTRDERVPRERREERVDSVHRIMTGQALTRNELRLAGFFIAVWFLMDLVQWLDWLSEKFR